MIRLICMSLLLIPVLFPTAVHAQSKADVAREMAEYVMRKFGKEASEEGVDKLTRTIDNLIVKSGDEGAAAVKKVGPRAFKLIDEAGENGVDAVKLMAKYGDEAVWVVSKQPRLAMAMNYGDEAAEAMIKHGEMVEPLIGKFGNSASLAFRNVTAQNARRIAMLDESAELATMGRTDELLAVVGKYGDSAMEFIWKNKASLAVAAGLTAFLADPKPFLDGTRDLAAVIGTSVVQPIADEVGKRTNWTLVIVSVIVAGAGLLGLRNWWRRPVPKES